MTGMPDNSTPPPTPEGVLIGEAVEVSGRSIRSLAAEAGMSDTRWRQIVRGYQTNTAGKVIEAKASSGTLARMALVVGLPAEQLAEVGRNDAADLLKLTPAPVPSAAAYHAGTVRALLEEADGLLGKRTQGGLSLNDHQMIRTLSALAQAHAAAASLPSMPHVPANEVLDMGDD